MLLDCGLFASAIDADSPTPQNQKEEGGYYTWSADELNALSIPNRDFFNDYYDITPILAGKVNMFCTAVNPFRGCNPT